MAKANIEVAKDILIKFDGNKAKLYEFIDNCDEAISIIKYEQKITSFTIIETKITDNGNARYLIRNCSFNDWDALKTFLVETYSEKWTMNQWQLNSFSAKSKQTIVSYSSRIEDCYIKLVYSVDNDLTREACEACTKLLRKQALNVCM